MLTIGNKLDKNGAQTSRHANTLSVTVPTGCNSQTLRHNKGKRRKKQRLIDLQIFILCDDYNKASKSTEIAQVTAAQVKCPHKIPVPNVATGF